VVYFDDYYGAEREGTQLRRSRGTFPRNEHSQVGQNYKVEQGGSRLRAIRIYVSLI
jgi:hypothetical protein